MTHSDEDTARIQTLTRIAARQLQHLEYTDKRIFAGSTTAEILQQLRESSEFAERVDAFVSRFGRLQDTLGNKLLPALLSISGEPVSTALNNLDRAEKLGWLESSDRWFEGRRLRNLMVHDYLEDPQYLGDALDACHNLVPMLAQTLSVFIAELQQHGLEET